MGILLSCYFCLGDFTKWSLSLSIDNQAEVEQKSSPNDVNYKKNPDGTYRGEGSVLFILTKGQFQAVLNPDKPK